MKWSIYYHNAPIALELGSDVTVEPIDDNRRFDAVTYESLARELAKTDRRRLLEHPSPLCVVNDGFRNTPTCEILTLLERFSPGFLNRCHVLISTGTHTAPTEKHLEQIFGQHLKTVRARVAAHDCKDDGSMVRIGIDQFGKPCYLNQQAAKSESTIIIGSVEPHYFAGLTGGRKSFFPGLTDFATVERNHNLASSLEARPLRLAGNPVAEHLQAIMDIFPTENVLSLQAVMDSHERVIGLFAGSLNDSFGRGVDLATEVYARHVTERYDCVIAELLAPLDANLYQAQKGLENCQAGVRDGGLIIVVAACHEGVGSDYFFKLAEQWDMEKNQAKDGVARFGSHKLSRVNAMSKRMNVYIHSMLPDTTVRKVFYEPCANIDETIEKHRNGQKNYRIALVRNAGHRVLTV